MVCISCDRADTHKLTHTFPHHEHSRSDLWRNHVHHRARCAYRSPGILVYQGR
jgi:hypothetical protein